MWSICGRGLTPGLSSTRKLNCRSNYHWLPLDARGRARSAQDQAVLGMPADADLGPGLVAIFGARPVGLLLDGNEARAVADRDRDLSRHAEVYARLDRALEGDHPVLDLVDRDLLRSHRDPDHVA